MRAVRVVLHIFGIGQAVSGMNVCLDGGICFSLFCYGCIVRCVLFLSFLVSFVDYVVYL